MFYFEITTRLVKLGKESAPGQNDGLISHPSELHEIKTGSPGPLEDDDDEVAGDKDRRVLGLGLRWDRVNQMLEVCFNEVVNEIDLIFDSLEMLAFWVRCNSD